MVFHEKQIFGITFYHKKNFSKQASVNTGRSMVDGNFRTLNNE